MITEDNCLTLSHCSKWCALIGKCTLQCDTIHMSGFNASVMYMWMTLYSIEFLELRISCFEGVSRVQGIFPL